MNIDKGLLKTYLDDFLVISIFLTITLFSIYFSFWLMCNLGGLCLW